MPAISGSRLSPAVQKEMFPLVDKDGLTKPVIQIIGEEAIEAGVEEICIVTQPGEEAIYRQYFRRMNDETLRAFRGKDWAILASEKLQAFGERLRFVAQDSPEGYGHAVYQAREFVGDEPFLLLLGDHIYIASEGDGGNCAAQLIEHYQASGLGAMSAVQATPRRKLHLFGTVRGEPSGEDGQYLVTAIREKPDEATADREMRTPGLPVGQFLCFFGMNIFPPQIFDSLRHHIDQDLREGGEIQLTDAIADLIARQPVEAYAMRGRTFDCGSKAGYLQAILHYAAKDPALAEVLAEADIVGPAPTKLDRGGK